MKYGKHKSFDKELKPSMRWLSSIDEVKKIILGRCESCRHKYPPGFLRVQSEDSGGLNIKAYGGRGIIDVFIVTDDTQSVTQAISDRFNCK